MFDIQPIVQKENNQCLLIAGPCSAESKEQVFETASLLCKETKINLFRCGIWKPRTSPKSFEGLGLKALPWLDEIQELYHIPVCVEVASPFHLENAYKHHIKHFWIGARTTVNPFLVQSIADAAQGNDVGIMIKNPISPDLNLWIGAFERFAKAGITRLAAVHRGFSTYEHSMYRNNPLWNIPIELKRLHPEIPIICDPSHLTGKKDYLFEVAQKALFLNADGLMLEVHAHPEKALSDKRQQLTPFEFSQLIHKLSFPSSIEKQDVLLRRFRQQIDELDKDLCALLCKRFEVIRNIADYKKEKNISLLQINRWQQVLDNVLHECEQKQIDEKFMQKIMELLHEESLKIQEEILKKER